MHTYRAILSYSDYEREIVYLEAYTRAHAWHMIADTRAVRNGNVGTISIVKV